MTRTIIRAARGAAAALTVTGVLPALCCAALLALGDAGWALAALGLAVGGALALRWLDAQLAGGAA